MEFNYGLKHTTLSEDIKNYLIDCIMNRKIYKPGDKIVETQIAKELKVSQAPVREAIKELKIMGFIESEPYKGSYVKEISARELKEIYSVRAALEELAIKQAFNNISNEMTEKMQNIVNQMAEAVQSHNYILLSELDWEFHNMLILASENSILKKIYTDLGIKYWIIRGITYLASHNMFDYQEQVLKHQPLLDAIKNKDLEAAISLTRGLYEKNIT